MENTTPEERADFQTNSMTELLKLSKEQAEQVKEIVTIQRKKTNEIND